MRGEPKLILRALAVSIFAVAGLLIAVPTASLAADTRDDRVPRYDHIFVIVEENKDYEQILGGAHSPNIAALAKTYGSATQFYSEVHPSEANYVALLGGDTYGIHDDDAFYCKPHDKRPFCYGAAAAGYADHTVHAPHLGDQLQAAGLTWKGYYEDLPSPGSDAVWAAGGKVITNSSAALYASKHSGFINFASVQSDPFRAGHVVGFDQLDADIASGALPSFALIVPNQCNEMHGLPAPGEPLDCMSLNTAGLIRRGDAVIGQLVRKLQGTGAWKDSGNMAIVITFDEGSGRTRSGCCAVTPNAPSNYGGGRIPTIVITNHGPRGVTDDTAYNHYSLLRTMEDAFGIKDHLAHAAESDKGVVAMDKLFERREGWLEKLLGK